MMTFYSPGEPEVTLKELDLCSEMTRKAVWIDVCEPTKEEEQALEAALGTGIPTREEMREIELSSRLYKEGDVLFMTATVLLKADTSHPESDAVTFILTPERLITLRYANPVAFQAFRNERAKNKHDYKGGPEVLIGLIDAIVERVADILENVGVTLDQVSMEIFNGRKADESSDGAKRAGRVTMGGRKQAQRDFVNILRRMGSVSDLISRTRESLVSFGRIVAYFRENHKDNAAARDALTHSKTVIGDLGSLSDHATFLSGKVSFMLDGTLGMINNEQNAIIRIVSVAAAVFLPPTVVASIYGMNFKVMPELQWPHGYPFALVLMLISAVLPYLYFKRKGWL